MFTVHHISNHDVKYFNNSLKMVDFVINIKYLEGLEHLLLYYKYNIILLYYNIIL